MTAHVSRTEDPGAPGDPLAESVAVDWLADGRLDVSLALADKRFSTGLASARSVPSITLSRTAMGRRRRRTRPAAMWVTTANPVSPETRESVHWQPPRPPR